VRRKETVRASIPSKVFLFGEYAVLAGLPAAAVALAPRFSAETIDGSGGDGVPPRSPWGRLERHAGRAISLAFQDPFRGAGGFGASTAQFALAFAAWQAASAPGAPATPSSPANAVQAWRLYKELSADEAVPPSGADLVAQIHGGVTVFDPAARGCRATGSGIRWDSFLVFSATAQEGRKVATHVHLAERAERRDLEPASPLVRALERPLREGLQALDGGDTVALGRAMDAYGRALWSHGLECEATSRDRYALGLLPGVLALKGAGALQSDALIALIDPALPEDEKLHSRRALISAAENRGLELVCDGIRPEEGLRWEP
jgi:hypothetical protein